MEESDTFLFSTLSKVWHAPNRISQNS